jgi:subtilisin family serine protease
LSSSRVGRAAGRRHASRNAIWIALSVAAFVALSVVSAAGAANNPIVAPNAGQKFTPVLTPIGLSNKPTTLVVQLSGDPITVADANAASPLSQGQKDSIRSQLRSQQAPVAQQIQSLGGHVLASYQAAYNGFKVQIAANQAAALAALPGVTGVYTLPTYKPDNVNSVPLVGGPQVWDPVNGNFHGEDIKIADIDTGIDYTHADFGGSGKPADYLAALASDTQPASPWWFGPGAPKVKGGTDLVGDDYDASGVTGSPTPVPDPNPLDCNSHGTHTAGTMAGFGVLSTGHTYTGPYDKNTVSSNTWNVGPGMAPKADLYAVKIFGCSGSTNEVIDAIEWAVDHNMDVINMSLGAPFGATDTPDAVAATNAAKDGVIVVASSGNEGPNPYMTGDPASGSGVISAAANDPTPSFPTASLSLSGGGTVNAINANGYPVAAGTTYTIKVIQPPHNLGCNGPPPMGAPSDWTGVTLPANTLAVVDRGSCARVAKAIYGQAHNAAAVLMINDVDSLPPFEGPITVNPDTGVAANVTIPFFGVASSDGAALRAADGQTVTVTPGTSANPGFEALASFSSWGPATGSSALKPNITAPGVSIFSAGMGTGIGALNDSGTSMAAPHVTGEAALVKQAHPDWRKVKYWVAAIENTADPSKVSGYAMRGAGTGFAQALPAVQTQVVALGDKDNGDLSFGFNELSRDFSQTGFIKLKNFGNAPATFSVTDALAAGSPHTTAFPSSVTVFGHGGEALVPVRLTVPDGTAGGAVTPCAGVTCAAPGPFSDVSGEITLTPAAGSNNGVTLRVPYYMVPQAVSDVDVHGVNANQLRRTGHANATVTNSHSVAATGTADWYAWGIKDKRDHGLKSNDLKAVGVQSLPTAVIDLGSPGSPDLHTGLLNIAIATNHRWSNAAMDEFDILVDVNGDGNADYEIVAADFGALTTGSFDGVDAVAVFDINQPGPVLIDFLADSPTDSSTIVVPVLFDQLKDSNPATSLGGANPRFTYSVVATGLTDGTIDSSDTSAVFNPYSPAVSTGMFDILPPGGSATETLTVNAAEQAHSPALGWMVVSHENESNNEANFIDLPDLGSHH